MFCKLWAELVLDQSFCCSYGKSSDSGDGSCR